MRFQRKKVAVALACALGAGGAVTMLYAGTAAAQVKVDVTGSSIKRVEGEGALPVTVLTRDEIDKSGATTVPEILNLISANNSSGGVQISNVVGVTSYSNQTASLRGLGGTGTLVLVNGKRLGAFSGGVQATEGTNLAFIPFAAIERVEVLKDGASAIYGTDAIGGVINFILRKDFTGVSVTAYTGDTQHGGGNHQQATATAGYGSLATDRFNAFVTVDWQKDQRLRARERPFSRTAYLPDEGINKLSSQTFPANFRSNGVNYNPTFGQAGIIGRFFKIGIHVKL